MNDPLENVFLQELYVKVTDQRTVIGTITYSMADVHSVSLTERPKSRRPLLLIGAGMLLILWATLDQTTHFVPFFFIGTVLPLAGIAMYLLGKPTFAILIEGPLGQKSILRSRDALFMQRIVEAMKSAIAYRDQMAQGAVRQKTRSKVVTKKGRSRSQAVKT